MEEKNKDKSINSSDSGDKTKIVKTQKEKTQLNPLKTLINKTPLKI